MLLALLAGGCRCGEVTAPAVDPELAATLVVSRDSSRIGGAHVSWDVLINGEQYGHLGLGNTQLFLFEPSPQSNTLRLKVRSGIDSGMIQFQASQGEMITFAASPGRSNKIEVKRLWAKKLGKPKPPPLTAEQKEERMEAARKAAAKKRSRSLKDTGGLSGYLVHWLRPVYQQMPPLGGWDWLVFVVLLCLLGRVLTLPFRWKAGFDKTSLWFLLAINITTLGLNAWFLQTDAAVTLLGNRLWFDALPLSATSRGLFWFSLVFSALVGGVGLALAAHYDYAPSRVATAHMEAGALVLVHVFYWYWSITSLVVFVACLSSTVLMELLRVSYTRLMRWKRG